MNDFVQIKFTIYILYKKASKVFNLAERKKCEFSLKKILKYLIDFMTDIYEGSIYLQCKAIALELWE